MKLEGCDFAVIGGDMRQVYTARILEKRGYRVKSFALCCGEHPASPGNLREVVGSARTVIAPVPLSADKVYMNQRSGNPPVLLSELLDSLREEQELFAGCIPEDFFDAAGKKGIKAVDLMVQEEVAVYNTIATAEGAVAEAIIKYPGNLRKSRCMVLGYGRCGQTLTMLLKGMGCQVYVCEKMPAQAARAAVQADAVFGLEELEGFLTESDLIFNTVPAPVLTKKRISRIKPSACIFDLASAPGGTDFDAAEEQGISAWLLPGLPGRYAPEASAEGLVHFILQYRNHR